MGRKIVVGADSAHLASEMSDVIVFDGETPPPAREGQCIHLVKDLDEALLAVRYIFGTPPAIASLGGAEVIGTNETRRQAIEARLCEFIEDLGNCSIDSWEGALNAIRNGPRIGPSSVTSNGLLRSLQGYPAICLGAGPSADPAALEHVARLRRNHYVFAADSMLGACRNAGFSPHFVTMIERPQVMHQYVAMQGRESTLIAPPVVDPKCVAEFDRVCWWWAGDALYAWLDPQQFVVGPGRSAGTLSVAAAILAGCNPIYLIGHDLAYAPGRVGHSITAHAFAANVQREDDEKLPGGRYALTQFEVPGYSGAPVLTNGLWNLFRGDIEMMVAANPGVRVLSAQKYQGAAIAGVPVGDLPEFGPLEKVPQFPSIPKSCITNPAERVKALEPDIVGLYKRSLLALKYLEGPEPNLPEIAKHLSVSTWAKPENAAFFDYLLRPINYSLSLRMHLRADEPHETEKLWRSSLGIFCRTAAALAHRIATDLCPTPAKSS